MAMIHMEPQTLQLFERVLGTLKPPPNLTLSQWADKYRRLSAEASSAKGQWNTDNAPFQREIMDAIGDVHIRKVVAMMCAQAGKTEGLILNTVGFYMSYYPAPIMIVQPTVNLGESFSKDRLATMIRDTPILRGLVDNKSRYSGNTITKKNFPGGQLTIIGANSPTDLRGRPIKVLLADEVDAYKASAGKEGDPIMLAEERQTTYWDHKTVLVSTPTTKASSRILDEFNASTQEEWNVPCPNCGKYQPFVWDGMVFDKEKWPKGGVQYRCAECGCLDNEFRWKKNSIHGKWVAAHPERKVRGFHMNKMGSTLCGWNEIVEKFIAADLDASRGDYEKMQVFVNTNLGLPWEEPGETVETTALIDRREFYEAEVPDGVLYLTCGIDTQDNRFEAEVVGWGIGKESWGIRYQRIYGDLKRGQVWADLDDFLSTTWKKRDGTELSIRAACMDSGGHFPDQVIRFCKEREDRHIWAIKGRGGMDVPYIRNPTKNNRVGGELFVLGVDTGKNAVLARLKVLIKGPNYCHFPAAEDAGYDEAYFKMLTAEHKLTIQDMIDIQKSLANELASLAALEATTSFAQEMATKASGKPVEFFKLMPRAKIKQVQTAILLSLNAKTKSDPAKHIVKFDAPYTYNGEEKADIKGKTFESVDLSGVGELNTMSESMAENRLAGYGFTPVNTGHNYAYVCIIASMGTGYPVDYFTGLPLCEAAKLRDAVDADFFE